MCERTWRRRREWGLVDPWGSTLVEPPPLEGTIRAHSSLGKPQGVEGQERGWMKSGCGWNKSIVGTNSKMTCRNREYFLLSAPCSESQGAEEKGKNIYHVPTLHQTFCLHFQVTSFKLRRNCSRLFHPPHSIGKSRSPYRWRYLRSRVGGSQVRPGVPACKALCHIASQTLQYFYRSRNRGHHICSDMFFFRIFRD